MTQYYEDDKFSRTNFSSHLRSDRDALLPTNEHPSSQLTPLNERSNRREGRQVKSERQEKQVVRLQKELQVKDKIIGELKNIIKISNESGATRLKSVYLQGERLEERSRYSEECYLDELKENHDQIKILTIENNKLLGIIEKMSLCGDFNKENQLWQRGRAETGNWQTDKNQRLQNSQINRLRELISEKELFYEKKIDEFISSHRSLAEECQQLEEDKNTALDENERLMRLVRDLEEGSRRSGLREEGRAVLPEKLTIIKIKEQYAESLKQFQGTITIQIEHIFDVFRSSLEEVGRKVSLLERRLCTIEQSVRERILQNLQIKFGRSSKKNSKIYIEEGDSFSEKGSRSASEQEQYPSRQFEAKDCTESRMCGQSGCERHHSEELVRPLYGEISQLKTVIATLESQLSEREDYYTFREREAQSTAELQICRQRLQSMRLERDKREKQLIEENRGLKQQMAQLQLTYKEEGAGVLQMWSRKLQERENLIVSLTGEVNSCQSKYKGVVEQMRKLEQRVGAEERLGKEVDGLKVELQASYSKVEQYRKLCLVLREESEQNVLGGEFLEDMKRQVNVFRVKHQENMGRLQTLEKENKSTITANREMKVRLEQTLANYHQALNQKNRCQQQIAELERQKLDLIHKVGCLETLTKGLQEQIKAKTQQQGKLVAERNSLQTDIVSYLTLFNSVAFTEVKPASEEASLEQLLCKISKLQTSLLDATTSRKSRREQLTKLLSGQLGGVEFC